MGVDLRLLPLIGENYWAAHSMLSVERRRELWDEILKLPVRDVPEPLSCFLARGSDGECCYGDIKDDPYGGSLKWTTPADLLTVRDHEGVQDNKINQAIWAWLEKMPPDWPVVLYWH